MEEEKSDWGWDSKFSRLSRWESYWMIYDFSTLGKKLQIHAIQLKIFTTSILRAEGNSPIFPCNEMKTEDQKTFLEQLQWHREKFTTSLIISSLTLWWQLDNARIFTMCHCRVDSVDQPIAKTNQTPTVTTTTPSLFYLVCTPCGKE